MMMATITIISITLIFMIEATTGYRSSSMARYNSRISVNNQRQINANCLGRNQFRLNAKKRRSLISPINPISQNDKEIKNNANTANPTIPDTLIIRRRDEASDTLSNFDTSTISAQSAGVNSATASVDGNIKFIIDKDLQQLDSYKSMNNDGLSGQQEGTSVFDKVKDILSSVLIADFFLIMAFLLWFIVAAALQSTYPVVLERFQDIFQPVVVPSLTVLMVGSIASGLSGKKKDNEY